MRDGSPAKLHCMKFSPWIGPQVAALIRDADDGAREIAAIWRDVGRRARRRKLLQPSYESVRRLVREQRRSPRHGYSRLKRAAILAFELVFRTREPRLVILDAITGDDIDRRQQIYRRRPRDE